MVLLETVHMHVQPYATATPLSRTLHNLQTRRNFGERVLSIFLATIMVAIFDYNSSSRLGRVINLYHGGERRSTIRRGVGWAFPPYPYRCLYLQINHVEKTIASFLRFTCPNTTTALQATHCKIVNFKTLPRRDIPLLIKQVFAPYCNIRTERKKNRGTVTYSTDQEYEGLVRYLLHLWVQTEDQDFNLNKLLNKAGRTVKYGPLNRPITAHELTERSNRSLYRKLK